LLQGLLLVRFTRVTGAVEVGEEVVGVEAGVGVEAEVGEVVGVGAVGVIAVATLTLPGITRTIPVTTAVTDTILTAPRRTIMDPIQTTMGQIQRIHRLSIS